MVKGLSESIHCCFFYNGSEKAKPYLVVSNCQNEDKDAVFAFINRLVDSEKENISKFDHFVVYTNGPTSEFKNRYIVRFLTKLKGELHAKSA